MGLSSLSYPLPLKRREVPWSIVKRHMRRLDEPIYRRHHRVKQLLTQAGRSHRSPRHPGTQQEDLPDTPRPMDGPTELLRFGNIATCLAFANGQSEKLHLDLHDDRHLYTTLLVLGRQGGDWDRSTGRGDLLLPTLGLSLPSTQATSSYSSSHCSPTPSTRYHPQR